MLMRALSASAGICAGSGYDVYLDGVVGPWFFNTWLGAAREHGVGLHFLALMPDEDTAAHRAVSRTNVGAMKDPDVARRMWRVFQGHDLPAGHVLGNSVQPPDETVDRILDGLAKGQFRLA